MKSNRALFENRAIKSFDAVGDVTKQLITLATGIIGVSITFGKDLYSGGPLWTRIVLVGGWIVFLLSIVFGVLTLQAIAGRFDSASRPFRGEITVYDSQVNGTSLLQNILFGLATLCIIVAAAGLMFSGPVKPEVKPAPSVVVVKQVCTCANCNRPPRKM